MDTQTLLSEAKARFAHNSAKHYLQEKFSNKLLIAEQGGLWKADAQTIGFLNSFTSDTLVALDVYNNPLKIQRKELVDKLTTLYDTVMNQWYEEYKELENKR